MDVSRTTFVDAPPEKVWALVSDLPGMGALSPEAAGGEWQDGATGPSVGATFKGQNEHGSKSWSTVSTVTASEPGRLFSFDVKAGPLSVSTWSYVLEPEGTGTRLTEEWTDNRGAVLKKTGPIATGVKDRNGHNARGMDETLAAVKAAAEA